MHKKILVVDDNVSFRGVLEDILKEENFIVNTASDGQEAWKFLKENSVDLVVTDNNMPKMTGLELIAKIREAQPSITCSIILISGLPQSTEAMDKVDVFLRKPFRMDLFISTVKNLLEK